MPASPERGRGQAGCQEGVWGDRSPPGCPCWDYGGAGSGGCGPPGECIWPALPAWPQCRDWKGNGKLLLGERLVQQRAMSASPTDGGGTGPVLPPCTKASGVPNVTGLGEGVALSLGSHAFQVTSPELAGGSRPHHPCWEQWGPPSRLPHVPPAAGLRERCLQPLVLLLTLPAPLPCPETPPGLLGPTLPAHPWGNRPEPPTLCCSCVQGRREGWRNGEM